MSKYITAVSAAIIAAQALNPLVPEKDHAELSNVTLEQSVNADAFRLNLFSGKTIPIYVNKFLDSLVCGDNSFGDGQRLEREHNELFAEAIGNDGRQVEFYTSSNGYITMALKFSNSLFSNFRCVVEGVKFQEVISDDERKELFNPFTFNFPPRLSYDGQWNEEDEENIRKMYITKNRIASSGNMQCGSHDDVVTVLKLRYNQNLEAKFDGYLGEIGGEYHIFASRNGFGYIIAYDDDENIKKKHKVIEGESWTIIFKIMDYNFSCLVYNGKHFKIKKEPLGEDV